MRCERVRADAEGIEEQVVYDTLRRLGCDIAQGFLINRPAPAADLTGLKPIARPHTPAPR